MNMSHHMLAKSLNSAEIAGQLQLSDGIVRIHASAIFNKYGGSDRTQAAVIAIQYALEN